MSDIIITTVYQATIYICNKVCIIITGVYCMYLYMLFKILEFQKISAVESIRRIFLLQPSVLFCTMSALCAHRLCLFIVDRFPARHIHGVAHEMIAYEYSCWCCSLMLTSILLALLSFIFIFAFLSASICCQIHV